MNLLLIAGVLFVCFSVAAFVDQPGEE